MVKNPICLLAKNSNKMPFIDTPAGQTNYCEACEEESHNALATDYHTCGKPMTKEPKKSDCCGAATWGNEKHPRCHSCGKPCTTSEGEKEHGCSEPCCQERTCPKCFQKLSKCSCRFFHCPKENCDTHQDSQTFRTCPIHGIPTFPDEWREQQLNEKPTPTKT